MSNETYDLEDHQLVDSTFLKASTVNNLNNRNVDVYIGRDTDVFFEENNEDDYDIDDNSLMEMSTVYGEIYYELKRFTERMGMPFLEKNSDYVQLYQFLDMMDEFFN